jgi:hypothetical protein
MFHKVKNVVPLDNLVLLVEFQNGQKKKYDVKPLMGKWGVFRDLKNGTLFRLVKVDTGGYGVVWNEYIDLACDELWDNGTDIPDEWDSDFTKLTPSERKRLSRAEKEIMNGETVDHTDLDWN